MYVKREVLVTVIVLVFNVEKYLPVCIDSILAQSYHHFELILVDDGSSDKSGAICDAYAIKDNRVRVIHVPNGGVSNARNVGIELAKGDYLFFVDADDLVDPTYIQNLLPLSDENLVYGGYRNILADGTEVFCVHTEETVSTEDIRNDFLQKQITFVRCACYKREIIINNGIRFDTTAILAEDVVFNLNYLEHCSVVHFLGSTDYRYYQRTQSAINRFNPEKLENQKNQSIQIESFYRRTDMRIRWFFWNSVCKHYEKWMHRGDSAVRKEALCGLRKTLKDPYFRESISYIRNNGSFDERFRTYFMCSIGYRFYRPVYQCIVFAHKIKNRITSMGER